MNKTTLIIFALILCISACKSKNKSAADEIMDKLPANKENLNVGDENYTLDVPTNWTTKHTTYRGVNYYFLMAPHVPGDFNTNVNVVTENMHEDDLPTYETNTVATMLRVMPTAKITDKGGDIEANGIKGTWFAYTMTQDGNALSLVCYIFPVNKVAYIITATTTPALAVSYRSTFDKIAQSLKWPQK